MLADEPTGNLDDDTGAAIADLLFELTEEAGATMILVTHDLAFAARCDRVLGLHQGGLRERGPAPSDRSALAAPA